MHRLGGETELVLGTPGLSSILEDLKVAGQDSELNDSQNLSILEAMAAVGVLEKGKKMF